MRREVIFSEADLERADSDVELRLRYFWTVGQNALLRSHRLRARGELRFAQVSAQFGRVLLDYVEEQHRPS